MKRALAVAAVTLSLGCSSEPEKPAPAPAHTPAPAKAPAADSTDDGKIVIKGSKHADDEPPAPRPVDDDVNARLAGLKESLAQPRGPHERAPYHAKNGMVQPRGWTEEEMDAVCAETRAKLSSGRFRFTRTLDPYCRFAFDPNEPRYVYIVDRYWGEGPFRYDRPVGIGKFETEVEGAWPGPEGPDFRPR